MADQRFFTHTGPITLQTIMELTGAKPVLRMGAADPKQSFADVAPLDRATKSDISFLDNIKYLDQFTTSKAGACFVRPKYIERAPEAMLLLVTEEPYTAFALASAHIYPSVIAQPGVISPQAQLAKSATIGKNVRIDAGAVIGERVVIGDGCHIGAGTVLHDGVEIGANSHIGALCSISHAILGSHVITHRGVHIGQDGFGFAPSARGIVKVPQLGRVLIGNHVEIGSGTCIDRGAGPDTTIGDHSKIDNLVQIGHNVAIGRYVVIAAQCGIAGSARIEDGVMLGGQIGVAGHITVGAGAKVAAQSGVMHDVPAKATYGGSPAISIKDWHRQTVTVAKIAKSQAEDRG
ncbi:MAG: UDP-3-O-(3-hydroxymyristoyl)glucosamine N-acyltransferase [Rickettsiales bacterium]|nr:UDP-3-O-(3-hydroxymyristoyl)glucosamine N-acyltransferase [Rickettsiales bacterium]